MCVCVCVCVCECERERERYRCSRTTDEATKYIYSSTVLKYKFELFFFFTLLEYFQFSVQQLEMYCCLVECKVNFCHFENRHSRGVENNTRSTMNHSIRWEEIAQKSPHSMGWNCTTPATPNTQVAEITPKSPLNGNTSPLAVVSGTLPTSFRPRLLELLPKPH